ncbi:MAG: endonuclease/exonuclease/phosphatase family protein [Phycisphaerales bacterium]|nr:endonuclease/exonuclease/phosphatase family protein [Planctomycetota bacterium]MCH8508382.1 endonuclease/exonuclease/phosphatase family protein [Phycisphaerales bacterium]
MTWNVNVRTRRQVEQAERVGFFSPDVVCLQEVNRSTVEGWRDWFKQVGYHVLDSVGGVHGKDGNKRRRYGVLVASRWPVTSGDKALPVPWPERTLTCAVDAPTGPLEVHTVHLPAGSRDNQQGTFTKIETFEGIANGLGRPSGHARVLCGDFNSPQDERPDGSVMGWGGRRTKDGEIVARRSDRMRRQLAAETSVMVNLREHGWFDAYRAIHPATDGLGPDHSFRQRRHGKVWLKRFDHVFASGPLAAKSAQYDLEALDLGLSDHAGLVVDFAFKG